MMAFRRGGCAAHFYLFVFKHLHPSNFWFSPPGCRDWMKPYQTDRIAMVGLSAATSNKN
jgi:hypothetical protein